MVKRSTGNLVLRRLFTAKWPAVEIKIIGNPTTARLDPFSSSSAAAPYGRMDGRGRPAGPSRSAAYARFVNDLHRPVSASAAAPLRTSLPWNYHHRHHHPAATSRGGDSARPSTRTLKGQRSDPSPGDASVWGVRWRRRRRRRYHQSVGQFPRTTQCVDNSTAPAAAAKWKQQQQHPNTASAYD